MPTCLICHKEYNGLSVVCEGCRITHDKNKGLEEESKLRDQFAMAALSGLAACSHPLRIEAAAAECYQWAEAMLTARRRAAFKVLKQPEAGDE